MSRTTAALIILVNLAIVVAGFGAVLLLGRLAEPLASGVNAWLFGTFGRYPASLLIIAMIVAAYVYVWHSEKTRKARQYALDRTIHVEKPNWWRQPTPFLRIPRVATYYLGLVLAVMIVIISMNAVEEEQRREASAAPSTASSPGPRFKGILVEPQPAPEPHREVR